MVKSFDHCLCDFFLQNLNSFKNSKLFEITGFYLKTEKLVIFSNDFFNAFNAKTPEFCKLVSDIIIVCKNHYNFIFKIIRYYLYISFFVYIFVFSFSFLLLLYGNDFCFKLTKVLLQMYCFWTYPICKFRFVFKYFFFWPFKIALLLFKLLCFILKSIFDMPKGNVTEALSKENSNYPADRTVYELNCIRNKTEKAWTYYNLYNDFTRVGHFLSKAMDESDQPKIDLHFQNFWNFNKNMRRVDTKYPCPNIHEWNDWYNNRK